MSFHGHSHVPQRHPVPQHPVAKHVPAPAAHSAAPAAAPAHAAAAPAAATQQVFSHLADGPTVATNNPNIIPSALSDVPDVHLNTAGLTPVSTGGVAAPTTAAPAAAPTTAAPAAAGTTPAHVRPTVAQYSGGLDAQIDADIKANRTERGTLDAQSKAKSPTAGATEKHLDGDRQHLLDELKERTSVYDAEIKGIDGKLGGQVPKHPDAAQAALLAQKAQLQKSEDKYSAQETASQRWHDRGEINSIDTQLKDPKLDPKVKTQLLAQKKELAHGLPQRGSNC